MPKPWYCAKRLFLAMAERARSDRGRDPRSSHRDNRKPAEPAIAPGCTRAGPKSSAAPPVVAPRYATPGHGDGGAPAEHAAERAPGDRAARRERVDRGRSRSRRRHRRRARAAAAAAAEESRREEEERRVAEDKRKPASKAAKSSSSSADSSSEEEVNVEPEPKQAAASSALVPRRGAAASDTPVAPVPMWLQKRVDDLSKKAVSFSRALVRAQQALKTSAIGLPGKPQQVSTLNSRISSWHSEIWTENSRRSPEGNP